MNFFNLLIGILFLIIGSITFYLIFSRKDNKIDDQLGTNLKDLCWCNYVYFCGIILIVKELIKNQLL